jgi:predicted esterase
LQVFIGHGVANSVTPMSMAREDHKLLYSAGLDVSFNSYATNHRIHENMLRDVNRWVIDRIQKMDA